MSPTIVIIDDMQESLDLFTALITLHIPQAQCITTTRGLEGIELTTAANPDLVLVDARLADIDGFEVVQRIRNNPKTKHIPILMVSGLMTSKKSRLSGFASGADGYLCKPFQPEELVAEINVLLRVKANEDHLRKHEAELEEELRRRTGALVESEERFRMLFESSPDAIFVENEEGDILDVNQAACDLHGLHREELLASSVIDLVPHELRQDLKQNFTSLFQQEGASFESSSLRKNGEIIPVEIRTRPIQYMNQNAIVLIVRDIRHRKKIEKALHDVAQNVSALTGHSFFNSLVHQLCEVLEVDFAIFATIEDASTKDLQSLAFCADGEIREDFHFSIEGSPYAILQGQEPTLVADDLRTLHPKFALAHTLDLKSFAAIPLFFSNGKPMGILSILHRAPIQDSPMALSMLKIFGARTAAEYERIQASERLWESEERYRSLTEDVLARSTVGILVLDRNFKVVWVNQTAEHVFGNERGTLLGQDMRALVENLMAPRTQNPERFRALLENSYQSGTYTESEIFQIRARHGQDLYLDYSSQPIRSGLYQGGRIEHFQDITQQKNLQDQLLQIQKMEGIGRLAGGVAHDFNNMLTTILGFGNLLLKQIPEDSPLQPGLQEIVNAGTRAENLTRQLLVFSRKQIMQIQAVNLNEIVENMEKLLLRMLGEDIEMMTSCSPDLPSVDADPGQLEQVIMNLAVNARDAMPDGGRLLLQTKWVHVHPEDLSNFAGGRAGHFVCLTISDSGCGIPSEIREHIYEPFFTTKPEDKGTGLGLSIVYGIVKQFNGFIQVDSAPEKGTTFHIYLPGGKHNDVSQKGSEDATLPHGSATILLVEDEESVRHLTRLLLTNLGYTVLCASNGLEGLEVYEENRREIDLVLTDVVMPKMGGTAMIQELRKRDASCRFLLTSGYARKPILGANSDEPPVPLLLKPYTRESLARKVYASLH